MCERCPSTLLGLLGEPDAAEVGMSRSISLCANVANGAIQADAINTGVLGWHAPVRTSPATEGGFKRNRFRGQLSFEISGQDGARVVLSVDGREAQPNKTGYEPLGKGSCEQRPTSVLGLCGGQSPSKTGLKLASGEPAPRDLSEGAERQFESASSERVCDPAHQRQHGATPRGGSVLVALINPSERTCPPGADERPAEFMRSLRWKQFTDLWVTERRRQLQAAQESKR